MKVQVTMDEALAKKLDDYADRNYTTRSGAVSLAVSQLIHADETRQALISLAVACQRIADTGTVDDDTMNAINELAVTCKVLSGQNS